VSAVENHNDPWSLILAEGRGQGLTALVRRWLNPQASKSHRELGGKPLGWEQTLHVTNGISPPHQRVAIIAHDHAINAGPAEWRQEAGKILVQPSDRETAAAVFLGLSHVRTHDPEATVVIYSSGHFICPEERFTKVVRSALKISKELRNWMILLGVRPPHFETPYGWIQPGATLGWVTGCHIRRVEALLEKPSLKSNKAALAVGCLCNTSILVANLSKLWAAGWCYFPDMLRLFQEYQQSIGSGEEEKVLHSIYDQVPPLNFFSDILQSVPEQIAVMELSDEIWSDWRKPGWAETLDLLRKKSVPAFEQMGMSGARLVFLNHH
jgi:mannose-1-phosphate guanylyltransferase